MQRRRPRHDRDDGREQRHRPRDGGAHAGGADGGYQSGGGGGWNGGGLAVASRQPRKGMLAVTVTVMRPQGTEPPSSRGLRTPPFQGGGTGSNPVGGAQVRSCGAVWSARRPVKPEVAGSNPVRTADECGDATGRVAQLAERAPEKREVTGSTPVPTTTESTGQRCSISTRGRFPQSSGHDEVIKPECWKASSTTTVAFVHGGHPRTKPVPEGATALRRLMRNLEQGVVRRQGRHRARPATAPLDADAPRSPAQDELLERYAPGRSFADIGCLWRIHGATFFAEELGATTVTAVDSEPSTAEFDAELERRHSKVRFVQGDIHDDAAIEEIGVHDVVRARASCTTRLRPLVVERLLSITEAPSSSATRRSRTSRGFHTPPCSSPA